ncbi:MAG: hypothetical protein IT266_07320 [Saprospiraceae bacterium]|nr:hypothetical protein [Saprospiraceae bacterium]
MDGYFQDRLYQALHDLFLIGNSNVEFLINFAWEKEDGNKYSEIAIKKAKEILKDTNILIIIGYSFPAYNYQIDKELFNCLPNDAKIRYQTADMNSEFQENKIKLLLTEAQKKDIHINHIHSKGNFLLPHEI